MRGKGVGKICDSLEKEYEKVDWFKLIMKVDGEVSKGVYTWGGFTVGLWENAYNDAVSELKGPCAKFKKELFSATRFSTSKE